MDDNRAGHVVACLDRTIMVQAVVMEGCVRQTVAKWKHWITLEVHVRSTGHGIVVYRGNLKENSIQLKLGKYPGCPSSEHLVPLDSDTRLKKHFS